MNRSYFALLLALALMQGALHAQDPFPISVAIHEIHYHPNLPTESVEFIELYNPTDSEIDLSGWSFSEGIDHVFSAGEMIGANTLYLLAQDAAAYNKKFGSIFTGGVKANVQWDAGMLSNTGETLTLRNAANKIIDQVDYQDGFPWPVSADGGGASMELVNALEDNGLSGHWRASVKPTPGKENAMRLENPPPAVRQVAHAPKAPTASDTVVVSAKATDADGVASMILALQVITPGSYIRLTDDAYATSWEMFPMNDAGTDGDETAGDATYSTTVPAAMMQHRALIRYRIHAEDLLGNTVALPYEDDPTPNQGFLVYNGVPAWSGSSSGKSPRREFTAEEMATLPVYHLIADGEDVERCQYRSSDESRRFRGTMVYDGRVYDHIEFKIRGEFSTYQSGKNKWKFFFNRGTDFSARDNYGLEYASPFRVMNFSACASPWVPANRGMSGLEESTAFRLHGLAGVPSPKTHHVHFRIIDDAEEAPVPDQYGGDLWGLYLSQQHPDGRLLNQLGLPDGNTFKIESGNGDQKHEGPFESNYGAFVSQARRTQTAEWWHENMNMEHYYSFRAMNRAVGNIDIREGWNHYFYHHPNGQWSPLPWDLDMTFMPETHWSGTIDAKACLNTDEIAIEYSNRCRELLDLLLSNGTASGGQVGSVIEETAQWLGSQKDWQDVATIAKAQSRAEVTTASPHGYATGDRITMVGVSADAYNGEHEITVVGDTSFSYPVSIFAAQSPAGDSIQVGKSVGAGSAWAQIDQAMWNNHPRSTGGHQDNFYANPTTQGFQGGTLTRTLPSADISGFAEYLKGFTTNTDPDDFKVGDGDQRGYGYNYVREESNDGKAPDRPIISYVGENDFPVDGLRFQSGEFSGGTIFAKQSFVSMQWRIGEIYNPSTPNYEANTPWRYEIAPVWESEAVTEFTAEMTVPANVLRPGSTYRARVRHLNQFGGWSRWSEPIEFVAGGPDLSVFADLVVTELMYHPGAPSEAEQAAGFRREDFEFVELYNRGATSTDLTLLRFTKGIDFDFDDGEVTTVAAGETVLIVANEAAFALRYGNDLPVAGSYSGSLANSGERLKLSVGAGTPLIEFTYDDGEGWPSESDGDGQSLVRIDPQTDANLSLAKSWVIGEPGGTPGNVSATVTPPTNRDTDGDGMSNEAEALAGTDPNNPNDVLRLMSIVRASSGVDLVWSSVIGKTYVVEYTGNLEGGDWETASELPAEDVVTLFEDIEASRTQKGEGYYRVRVQP